jgi:predicted enzyme related to lactoylglutathione lyase
MATFGGVYLDAGEWSDLETLRDFYRDTIGMTVSSEEPGESIWFSLGVTTFGFHVGDPVPENRWAVNLVVNTEPGVTIDEEATRLEAAGVALTMGPADMPWGARVITFVDPMGYAVWYMQQM